MRFIQTFQVFPDIPEPLAFLETLSRNLWWSWNQNAVELFRRINPRLWEASGRNPIVFATRVPQERFNELAHDDSYLAHLEQVRKRFENRVLNQTNGESPWDQGETVAYFSMEFGIHETLPLFAGGLGILAGDHLKAASGLKMPLVGVGLLYREGYFRQYLDKDGWQQETYPETDLYHLPLSKQKDKDGNDLVISLTGIGGDIHAQVWKIRIGRIPLILLDTNLPENTPEIRDITARLYSGEQYTRLAQEVLLGIGGMRALDALGIQPTVGHMNEGHCAFVGLERLRQLMDRYGISLEAAREVVSRTTVFTTHTPVAAGHDEFPPAMVKPYLKPFEARFDMSTDQLVALGQAGWGGGGVPLFHVHPGIAHRPVHQRCEQTPRAGGPSHVVPHLAHPIRRRDAHYPYHQRGPHPVGAGTGNQAAVRTVSGAPVEHGLHHPGKCQTHR